MPHRHPAERVRDSLITWSLVLCTLIGVGIGYFNWRYTEILSAPDWCNRALGASKFADSTPEFAVGGCFNLMREQISAIAWNSHVAIGSLAVVLVAIGVIALAGGKLTLNAGKDGISANVSKEATPAEVAQTVADVATEGAEAIANMPEPEFGNDLGVKTP